jgi:hypothetical protein
MPTGIVKRSLLVILRRRAAPSHFPPFWCNKGGERNGKKSEYKGGQLLIGHFLMG